MTTDAKSVGALLLESGESIVTAESWEGGGVWGWGSRGNPNPVRTNKGAARNRRPRRSATMIATNAAHP